MSTSEQLVDALRTALREREELRSRNDDLLAALREPIAIVSAGCRYPGGVRSPEGLWDLVLAGRDVIREPPGDRGWAAEVLGRYRGGFLDDVAEFDAGFFGISPREALAMEPQQRLLLHTCWEVLERAGIRPETLVGSPTGVWLGALASSASGIERFPEDIQVHLLTGATPSVVTGRIAYCFGLRGPAISVDTACSSSLVAIHLAGQALRAGDCTLAFAGGAAVLDTPLVFRTFDRQGGLAADGRCKAFSATADGVGWAEGVGVVLLERLSDARRNGHPVLAVLRGSAVNSDGASNGLTAPNGPAQRAVIRQALAAAGLSTADIDVVEAHGTGTPLGDPIEAQALLATYGQDRDRPLWLGSVKSNIGHTQAAAGVAGVIKMVQAMAHETMPMTLHADRPTDEVDWSAGTVALLTDHVAWKRDGRPRRAAVSSFGFSGTNAHVILEEPEPVAESGDSPDPAPPVVPWVISAKTAAALRDRAGQLVSGAGDASDLHLGAALVNDRSAFAHRAVVVGAGRPELLAGLAAVAGDQPGPSAVSGVAADAGQVAFVFGGQGSQWLGMGRELLESSPVFAGALAECDRALAGHTDHSVVELVRAPDAAALERVDVVQPVLFAVMVSLARLWQSVGVIPAMVTGHSQGEIAAAHIAGILSLVDAARLVALRSRILRDIAGQGAMASIELGPAELTARLCGRVGIAAVNGPDAVVVSGPVHEVEQLIAACAADGVRARRLPVDYASHSAAVEQVRDRLLAAAGGITPRPGTVPFMSTVDAQLVDWTALDAAYWYRNLRETVRFHDAVRRMAEAGITAFIEVSPHPVLVSAITRTLDAHGDEGTVLETIRRTDAGLRRFLLSAAKAYVAGLPVAWPSLFPAGTPHVPLPTYPFQTERYWLGEGGGSGATDPAGIGLASAAHPLLGALVDLPDQDGLLGTGRITQAAHPWLADHTVFGVTVLPGAALVELVATMGAGLGAGLVEELTMHAPLTVPQHDGVAIRVVVGAADDTGRRPVAVHSRPDGQDGPWSRNAAGTLAVAAPAAPVIDTEWPPPGTPLDITGVYQIGDGVAYGPAFQGLRMAWRSGDTVFAEVALPDAAGDTTEGFTLHPALLDAALHALGLGATEDSPVLLPFSWSGVRFRTGGATALRVRITPADGTGAVAVDLADQHGHPVASVAALAVRPAVASDIRAAADIRRDTLFHVAWQPVTAGAAHPPPVVLGPADGPVDADFADLGVLSAAIADGRAVPESVVLPVLAPHRPSLAADVVTEVLAVVQGWLAEPRFAGSRLVVVTAGAVDATEAVADLAAAAVRGLVRSAAAEHPGRFGLVDVDQVERATIGLGLSSGFAECAVRDGRVLVPCLVAAAEPPAANGPSWGRGSVLVTGGVSGVGAAVARHIAAAPGVRGMVLVGRRGMATPGAEQLVADLAGQGVEVTVHACDVGDRGALAEVIAGIPAHRPLTAVVHAAGVLADATVESLTGDQVRTVFRPKVSGAWHLHELTEHLDLSAFVLFSSFTALLGSAGQGNYVAANAFLEGLATLRRSAGLPATAIAWGLWDADSEMTGRLTDRDRDRMLRAGYVPLGTEESLALLDAATGSAEPVRAAVRLNLPALRERAAEGTLPALLGRLVRVPAGARSGPDGDAAALRDRLAAASAGERQEILTDLVRTVAASVLGHAGARAVPADRAFSDLGFDSLIAVEFRNQLAARTGLRLPATLVFDQPNPVAVAGYLAGLLRTDPAVLRDLDRLAGLLSDVDEELRGTVADRLRTMLARVEPAADQTDLDTVSDDELFSVLRRELRGGAIARPGADEEGDFR